MSTNKLRLQVFLEPVYVKELEYLATKRGLIGQSGMLEGQPRPALAAGDVLRVVLRKSRKRRLAAATKRKVR